MEKIIKQIIDIENRATQITEQACAACEDLPGQIEAELAKYEQRLEDECRVKYEQKVAALREQTQADGEAHTGMIAAACERLRASEAAHGDEWVRILWEGVIGDV